MATQENCNAALADLAVRIQRDARLAGLGTVRSLSNATKLPDSEGFMHGVSRSCISKIYNLQHFPCLDTLLALARVCDTTVSIWTEGMVQEQQEQQEPEQEQQEPEEDKGQPEQEQPEQEQPEQDEDDLMDSETEQAEQAEQDSDQGEPQDSDQGEPDQDKGQAPESDKKINLLDMLHGMAPNL